MNILLLGYGKMGKIIEEIALSRGHQIIARISEENKEERDALTPAAIDVAIEFSAPEAAVANISWALERGIRVVSGTTGWLSEKPRLDALASAQETAFFYASNFSIGVNIFFKVNAFLAKLMQEQSAYQVAIEEIHHTEKKRRPIRHSADPSRRCIGLTPCLQRVDTC
ncbi:dihydrodipicolinate reductase [Nitritalea halalkaliphila LW7]|uniref:Dihydrodipicolinate reductase n=1 Tax=Nitritalea halalkaliphila LW7 TaxID=1189621 RepID=I5BU35_9BACT|nr:dihydrodipicolinate reductase [Nitritalea halalkaliphila LW7]